MRCNPLMAKGELEFYEALLTQPQAARFACYRRAERKRPARTARPCSSLRKMPNLSAGNLQRDAEARRRRTALRNPDLRSIPPKSGPFASSAGSCFHDEPSAARSRSIVEVAGG